MKRRDLEDLTKKDLSLLAREADVAGRSTMTKDQLVEALADRDPKDNDLEDSPPRDIDTASPDSVDAERFKVR